MECQKFKNTAHSFNYGDFEKIKRDWKYKNSGNKMEVARNSLPNRDFLKKVRKFETKNKIVLTFDECTSI